MTLEVVKSGFSNVLFLIEIMCSIEKQNYQMLIFHPVLCKYFKLCVLPDNTKMSSGSMQLRYMMLGTLLNL